jgi:predicted O-methyltransferase YrrM
MQKRIIGLTAILLIFAWSFCSYPPEKESTQYDFTYDWLTSNLPVWEKVLSPYSNRPDIRYLEVGVFEGRSVIWMFENVLTHPSSTATVVDFFPGDLRQRFQANLEKSGVDGRVTVIDGLSQTVLRDLKPDSFDLIYIDAGHTAVMTLMDAVLCWDLLKIDGLMIFDDYAWNRKEYPAEIRPGVAIDGFITAFRNYLDLVHREYQVIIRKKKGPSIGDTYQTIMGDYAFVWQTDELQELVNGNQVELSESEKKALKKMILGRPFGATEFLLSPADLTNPAYLKLINRLEFEYRVGTKGNLSPRIGIFTASLISLLFGILGTYLFLRRKRRS